MEDLYLKRFAQSAFLALMALLSSSCSLKLQVAVFNNTGDELTVVIGRDSALVPLRASSRMSYPVNAQKRQMRLKLRGCWLTYALPEAAESYATQSGFAGAVALQVEPDERIILLAPDASQVVDVGSNKQAQIATFPLSPLERTCSE